MVEGRLPPYTRLQYDTRNMRTLSHIAQFLLKLNQASLSRSGPAAQ